MNVTDFKQKMLDLHAETYSLSNDIEDTYNKANALVYRLMQLTGYGSDADTYKAIVNEYKVQVSRRMQQKVECYEIEGDNLI